MTTRRGFLSLMLATASAPAIVKSTSLMKIWVPSQKIVIPSFASSYTDNMARSMNIMRSQMIEMINKMYADSGLLNDGKLYNYNPPATGPIRIRKPEQYRSYAG